MVAGGKTARQTNQTDVYLAEQHAQQIKVWKSPQFIVTYNKASTMTFLMNTHVYIDPTPGLYLL